MVLRILLAFILLISFLLSRGFSEDQADTQMRELDREIKIMTGELDDDWDNTQKELDRKWERYVAKIERKWSVFVGPTEKEWVAYSQDIEARSRVDFENGEISVSSIVSAEEGDEEDAKKKIAEQFKKAFSIDEETGTEPLKDQVKNKKGEVVSLGNIDDFIQKELFPKTLIEQKPIHSRDGVLRQQYTTRVKLVPNHLYIRAKKYIDPVKEYSEKFNLSPSLILAVIHTESFFNPFAKSHANAYGLMQLVPKFGAREAYRFLYRKDRIPAPQYLYNSDNNIKLGTAYLHLLKNHYFSSIEDLDKKRYLSISAYNCGPLCVNTRIINRYPVTQLSAAQLFKILRKKTPKETRDYLKKVEERVLIYAPLF